MSAAWSWIVLILALFPIVALLVWAVADLVRRPDISRGAKAGWMVVVVAIPLVGPALYLIYRPTRPADIRGFGGRRRGDTTPPDEGA